MAIFQAPMSVFKGLGSFKLGTAVSESCNELFLHWHSSWQRTLLLLKPNKSTKLPNPQFSLLCSGYSPLWGPTGGRAAALRRGSG